MMNTSALKKTVQNKNNSIKKADFWSLKLMN